LRQWYLKYERWNNKIVDNYVNKHWHIFNKNCLEKMIELVMNQASREFKHLSAEQLECLREGQLLTDEIVFRYLK
jgi:hypothetical protein